MDYSLIFLTGLTFGSLTCLSVQGGLLSSIVAVQSKGGGKKKNSFVSHIIPISSFLLSKLSVYFILGILLGALGEKIAFNDTMIVTMQIAAGLYMIAIAFHLLNVHPIFNYVLPHPPKFFSKLIKNQAKSKTIFAPMIFGALTVFIPCGSTLAMEALAMTASNPIQGGFVMGIFVLGTFPLFFLVGYLSTSMNAIFQRHFLKIAATLVIILGINSINNSLVVLDSPVTLQKISQSLPIELPFYKVSDEKVESRSLQDGKQIIDIKVSSSGYSPRRILVKNNQPVRIRLITEGVYNCALAFRIPSLKIAKNLKPNSVEEIEFIPRKEGKIYFTCAMGMFIGVIEVVDK